MFENLCSTVLLDTHRGSSEASCPTWASGARKSWQSPVPCRSLRSGLPRWSRRSFRSCVSLWTKGHWLLRQHRFHSHSVVWCAVHSIPWGLQGLVPLADPVALGSLACLYHHVSPLFQAHQVFLEVPLILAGPVNKRIIVLVGIYKNMVKVIQCGFSNVHKYSKHVQICAVKCYFFLKCAFRNTGLCKLMCSVCF